MNKYRDKSDFEINKAVAIAVGFPCYYGDGSYTNGLGIRAAIVKGENASGNYMLGGFDPCNNPADAMPIIIENRITVARDILNDEWCAHVGSVMDECDWDYVKEPKIYAHSDNYYRAAMICFLMMKDAENES